MCFNVVDFGWVFMWMGGLLVRDDLEFGYVM